MSAAGTTSRIDSLRIADRIWPEDAPRRPTIDKAALRRRAIISATRARLARMTSPAPVHRIARIVAPDCQRAWWAAIRPSRPVRSDAGLIRSGPLKVPPLVSAGVAGG